MEPIPTAKNQGAVSANPTNPAPAKINDSAVRISAKAVRSLANSVRLYAREVLNFSDSRCGIYYVISFSIKRYVRFLRNCFIFVIKSNAMARQNLNTQALAKALAALAAITMAVMWLLGNAGLYLSAVDQMATWHVLFNLSFIGLLGGVFEAAVWSYIFGYVFGVLYNKFV